MLKPGVTLGDPTGVGPELVGHARARWPELRVFGDASGFVAGRPDERSAVAQVAWLEEAVTAVRQGDISALVTAPISKFWAQRAGFAFAGQTEFLAARLKARDTAMMMAAPNLKVVLATTHIPLSEVPRILSQADVMRAIRLAAESLRRDFGIVHPRIGVCGLNPHAGENGLFGREEIEIIRPAIEAARPLTDADLVGPLAPDTAFAPVHEPRFDAIIALYHDQGLIPVKALAFHQTVNVTLGLPIVRTSPDHGVAYDLAGTGRARPDSMLAAVALAYAITARRREQC